MPELWRRDGREDGSDIDVGSPAEKAEIRRCDRRIGIEGAPFTDKGRRRRDSGRAQIRRT